MICTECGDKIGPYSKYVVVARMSYDNGGYELYVGCSHYPRGTYDSLGVAGSLDCLTKLFSRILKTECDHAPKEQEK